MTKPTHVMREPIAVFIARESKSLAEEGWTHDGDPADLHTMWSPPWDSPRARTTTPSTQGGSQASHRCRSGYVAAPYQDLIAAGLLPADARKSANGLHVTLSESLN